MGGSSAIFIKIHFDSASSLQEIISHEYMHTGNQEVV